MRDKPLGTGTWLLAPNAPLRNLMHMHDTRFRRMPARSDVVRRAAAADYKAALEHIADVLKAPADLAQREGGKEGPAGGPATSPTAAVGVPTPKSVVDTGSIHGGQPLPPSGPPATAPIADTAVKPVDAATPVSHSVWGRGASAAVSSNHLSAAPVVAAPSQRDPPEVFGLPSMHDNIVTEAIARDEESASTSAAAAAAAAAATAAAPAATLLPQVLHKLDAAATTAAAAPQAAKRPALRERRVPETQIGRAL